MVGLPVKVEKIRICSAVSTIEACNRRTDGQTDILRQHSPRYAYASCGKKNKISPAIVEARYTTD